MKLSNQEKRLYDFIVSYKGKFQRDPLYKEILIELNIGGGPASISRLMKRLEHKKAIKRGIFIIE